VENGPSGSALLLGDAVNFLMADTDGWQSPGRLTFTWPRTAHPTHGPRYSSDSPCRMLFRFHVYFVEYSKCPEGSTGVVVAAGDTRWRIAEAHDCESEGFRKANERLIPGDEERIT